MQGARQQCEACDKSVLPPGNSKRKRTKHAGRLSLFHQHHRSGDPSCLGAAQRVFGESPARTWAAKKRCSSPRNSRLRNRKRATSTGCHLARMAKFSIVADDDSHVAINDDGRVLGRDCSYRSVAPFCFLSEFHNVRLPTENFGASARLHHTPRASDILN